MSISSEISSIHQSNSSDHFSVNGTEANTESGMCSVEFLLSFLMSVPTNSYVIWLIVTGTGNGLAAEFSIFNFSACEILLSLEFLLRFFTFIFKISWIFVAIVDGLGITGRPLFQCLISVERYLAVVYPVTFLKFKPLRYKLMFFGVAWVATFSSGVINTVVWFYAYDLLYILWLPPFFLFLSIQIFCCVAVLRALKQSGPGERGNEREEENHMKRRAFYFILITTVSMVTVYAPYVFLIALIQSESESIFFCVGQICYTVAGLVEPVLFLYRVGKLNFIKCQ